MNELKKLEGIYLGRQVVDTNQQYMKYKSQFDVDGRVMNFMMFLPWTKKDGTPKKGVAPEELKEGKKYTIMFTEFKSATMQNPSKTAVVFLDSSKDPAPSTQLNNKQESSTRKMIDAESQVVTKMAEAYFRLTKPEQRNLNHFIGTIVRTLNNEDMAPLIELFNKNNPANGSTKEVKP